MKKTIFITGSSSGIGKATAAFFSVKGWNVAATMRSPEKEQELKNLKGVKIYKLDVTNPEEIEQTVSTVFHDFPTVDVLLNNAGYGAVGPFEKSTDQEVRQQFEVNVFGVMNLTRAFIPHLRKQGFGTIINVSSVSGQVTSPLYSLYNASKYSLEGFAESLQYELKDFNIRVKNIEPGPIKSDFRGRSMTIVEQEGVTGYEHLENSVYSKMEKRNETAPEPVIVAKTIYRAATDGKNKLRYPADRNAKLVLAFRKFVPNRWFNKLVYKQQIGSKKPS